MTLGSVTVFAFACMVLLTILLFLGFIRDLSAAINGIVPAIRIAESLIYLLAAVSTTLFLYVFKKSR